MRKISLGTIVSNKKVKLIVVLGFFLISLSLTPYFFNEHNDSNHTNSSYVDKNDPNSIENKKDESKLRMSDSLDWEIEPNLDRTFFSPNSSFGESDKVFHTFSVNQDANYTLNISKYYDPIDNYPGLMYAAKELGAAYLIPDGTWLIVLKNSRLVNNMVKNYFILGVGENASNIEWHEIGEFNTTSDLAVAGNETGHIYVSYIENKGIGVKNFTGVNYFYSEDWGLTWTNGTIVNYTAILENTDFYNQDPIYDLFHGISITEFNGNFTCMWSFLNGTDKSINESKICVSSLNCSYQWQKADNLTSLEKQYGIKPQIFFNRTNNNGTLYLAFNNITGKDPKGNYLQQLVISRFDNGLSNIISDIWNITDPTYDPDIYCTKDYSKEKFYFHEKKIGNDYYEGIKNASWGEDLTTRKIDIFNVESGNNFNLYGLNGPKCFSTDVQTEYGEELPGILDCEDPFHVLKINKTAKATISELFQFDGKDSKGKFQEANSYSFNLQVEDILDNCLFVYVDDIPADYNLNCNLNKISPFNSLNINDEFKLQVDSDKPGIIDLNIKFSEFLNHTSKITAQTYEISDPIICGDGRTHFLFFTEKRYDDDYLMISKSYDGGITWKNPYEITSFSGNNYNPKKALMNGTDIFLWTSDDFSDNDYLFISTNLGENFIKNKYGKTGNEFVDASNDLACWSGNNITNDKFSINKSMDLGFTWKNFCNISIKDPGNYSLLSVAHDPISGNYSFLLTHTYDKNLIFYTISNNGNDITHSDDLLEESNIMFETMEGMTQVDVKKNSSGTYEWIITSSVVNSVDFDNLSSKLAYCLSSDGIKFSEWKNFTEITGKEMDATNWDILFLENGGSTFCTSRHLRTSTKQIYTYSKSKYVFRKTEILDLNYDAEITFKGISNKGDILVDGLYDWEFILTDSGGARYIETGNLILDNTQPELMNSGITTNPLKPFPKDNVSVTVPVYEINPDKGYLYYRDPEGEWQEKAMQMDLSSYPYVDFSATIPSHPDNVSTVYWKAVIYDTCGNSLIVDNNGQLNSYSRGIFEYIKQTGKLNPTLYDDWHWTYIFTSGADHLDEVWIHKSLEGNGGVEEEDIILTPIDTYNTTYSIEICHDLEHFSGTYKFMFCSDEGDNYTIEEIQLKKPSIRIEQEDQPLSLLDLSQSASHNISFKIPEYAEYIDHLFIEYEYDNGEHKKTENMTKSGEVYTFKFQRFPKNATQVNYTVIAVDVFGNNVTWDQYQSIKLLPALPEWEMSAEVQAIVALCSLIIGVGCAIVYSSTMGSETQNPIEDKLGIKAEKDEKSLKTNERTEQDMGFIIGKLTSISKKGLMIGTLATLFAVATILAVVSIFGLKSSEIAMVLLTGAFLSMVTIWVLLFGHFTEKTFRLNQLKLPISYKIILLGISIIIYVVLFSIFLVGNTIAWWRVRVNELSYNIAGIRIPRALTTVTTAFFSSILLLTWSTLKELSKKTEEFFESMELNENPLKIAERKEKSINSIVNSIGKKGILFVTIIGVVIIFASDLSIYANQGMLIVIPFALGALLTLFIYSFRRKKEDPLIQKQLLDNTVICAQCGEKTALSGTYCEFCGNKMLSGERASDGIICENCKKINIRGGKFCRHCGSEMKGQDSEELEPEEISKSISEKEIESKKEDKDTKKDSEKDKKTKVNSTSKSN